MRPSWHVWCEMAPIDLNLLRAFSTLHEAGSFTAAAQRLGVPRSTVSRAIAELENVLGEQLVTRTTRTMSFTTEGQELFDRVAPALERVTAALADRPSKTDEPVGVIRVTSTPDVAAMVLAEAAVRYTSRYPKASIEIAATGTILDLVRDQVDLALRMTLKQLPASGMFAQKVGTLTVKMFAAPSYLARRGVPRAQADLADHERISFRGVVQRWQWTRASELLEGRIVCDDMFVMRELVRSGGGIGFLPTFVAEEDVQAGRIVEVLPKIVLSTATVFLVTPTKKHVASRVIAFRELLLDMLRRRPLTP